MTDPLLAEIDRMIEKQKALDDGEGYTAEALAVDVLSEAKRLIIADRERLVNELKAVTFMDPRDCLEFIDADKAIAIIKGES